MGTWLNAEIPAFAVVGRVNAGKTATLATLLEIDDDELLRISATPGETTEVQPLPVRYDGEELLRFLDTPGFQQPIEAMKEIQHLAGGGVPSDVPDAGCWVAPTLLAFDDQRSAAMRSELFGPVAGLVVAEDFDHALRLHNATDYGLVGALFTHDRAHEQRFIDHAEAGILSINGARPAFAATGPFVGWKSSGYGPPEHGRWNRDFYTRPQAVYGARGEG